MILLKMDMTDIQEIVKTAHQYKMEDGTPQWSQRIAPLGMTVNFLVVTNSARHSALMGCLLV